jgi:hypothetical protein
VGEHAPQAPVAGGAGGAAIPDGTLLLEPRDLFDPCLLGAAHRGGEYLAVYSQRCVLDALVADGLTEEDALDHYGFNVSGSIGWGFPVFLLDRDIEDD